MDKDTVATPSVADLSVAAESKPDPNIGARKWVDPNLPPLPEEDQPKDPLEPPKILKTRTQAKGVETRIPKGYARKGATLDGTMDSALKESDWQTVYKAYAETGDYEEIARQAGLTPQQVKHLMEKGIVRLGLPSIEDHAVSQSEVALRLQEYGLSWKDDNREDQKMALPEVQDAITNRVAKDALAAQQQLNNALDLGESVGKILQQVKIMLVNGRLEMPEEINLAYLGKLAVTMEKLAKATDIATRLSRLTAGQPETHVMHHVTGLISMLSPAEIQAFAESGELPRSLRGRVSDVIDVEVATPKKDDDDE